MHNVTSTCSIIRRAVLTGLGAATVLLTFPAVPASAQIVQPSVYFGSEVSDAQRNNSIIDKFEADTGRHQSIIQFGWPAERDGVLQPFQTQWFENIRLRGSIPQVQMGMWNHEGPTVDSHGFGPGTITQAMVLRGDFDAYLRQYAQDAKAWGHPFFLRWEHEMNGTWYPWSDGKNGNQTGDYVRAWHHVHDIFSSVGASNVTWVWCINLEDTTVSSQPLSEIYPGDSYVDWVAVDSYNNSTVPGSWLTPTQVFGMNPWGHHNSYLDLMAIAPSKPIEIAETATSNLGGDAAAWITELYGTDLPKLYPNIAAVLWFNDEYNHDVHETPAKLAAYSAGVANPYYATNTFKDLPAGPIKRLPLAASTYTDTVTASSTVQAGSPVSLASRVTSSATSTVIVNVEVHNASGTKVFQKFWTQTLTPNQPVTLATTWAVPSTLPAGTYSVKSGVFSANWSTRLYWNESAARVSVQ